MPRLSKYDPLEHQVATKDDVNKARLLAETVIEVEGKKLQFDAVSRQRIKDVIAGLNEGTVEWRMYDNQVHTLSKAELERLYSAAEGLMGQRTMQVFQRASELKSRIDAGESVTMAELRLERWAY